MIDPGRYDLTTLSNELNESTGFMRILNADEPLRELRTAFTTWSFVLVLPLLLLAVVRGLLLLRRLNVPGWTWLTTYFFAYGLLYLVLTGPVNSARYMMPFQLVVVLIAGNPRSVEWGESGRPRD